MEFNIVLKDEDGKEIDSYNISRSSSGEPKNMNDFILNLLSISEDKRKLPLMIQCPNGLEVHPAIKMKSKNFGSYLLGDELESMHITWDN